MSQDTKREILLREILVAIDTSSHSEAALEAAAALAKILEARIHGVFVQDEIWDKISRIPSSSSFVNEITGTIQPLKRQGLEEKIEKLQKRLRRRLETISREKRIKHRWDSLRGKVEDKILEAAEEADLITIGRRGSSFPRKKQLGSSAKAIIQKSEKPVLILSKGLRIGSKICVVYNGSHASQRALRLALTLAHRRESELIVLVADNNPDALDERNRDLENTLAETEVPTSVKLLKHTTFQSFLHSILALNSGMLIVTKEQPVIQNHLDSVIDHVGCPMLLVH